MTKTINKSEFLKAAQERVLILDGAMGTSLFSYNLSAEDYGGEALDGCPENLNNTRPEMIKEIHASFLEAGADIIETNTFGASRNVLAEYDLADESYKISKLATELARETADKYSTSEKPRFVAGSIGPGTKLPSLGNISYDKLRDGYVDQVKGMVDGGADYLLIETCQDPLQIKATLDACFTAFSELSEGLSEADIEKKYPRVEINSHNKNGLNGKFKLPIAVQVTVETMGTLLVGSEIASALTTVSAYPIDIIGMNCATGPQEMAEHIKFLCENTELLVSCVPNAGIPENIGGHTHYPLGASDLAEKLKHFSKDWGVNIVGGCCGTTPEHIQAVAKAIGKQKPQNRKTNREDTVSSLYNATPMIMEPAPLIVGERTNANGSKAFKEMLAAEDYDGIVALAQGQEQEGAHILDVCTAYVGRDESKDMHEVIYRLNTSINIPIMIDSTEAPVIEQALKLISGKAVVNSVNLEDGEERVEEIAKLCNKYGAALVALTIDEDGMAKTAEKKFAIAKRLYDLLVNKHGMNPSDIIYDTLTFTLGAGDDDLRNAGIETIEAIRMIKKELPETKTVLGVSNISFGLDAKLRAPLNSIFIFECVKAGLDMAIANSKKIIPLNKLDSDIRKYCEDLVYDRRTFKDKEKREIDYDPLMSLIGCLEDIKDHDAGDKNPYEGLEVEEILEKRIVDGNKIKIEADLDQALAKGHTALEIVNKFLMAGMKTVGDLFGAGEMQLPFVLQSATTMKTAVAYLEQFMEKEDNDAPKGTIVLATVKGDVHDIGKNLVNIILSNNGYKVVDLGIKQTIEEIIKAVDEHKPDVIGLSGLLVKSTMIMKQDLELLEERGYKIPVILGGAALTRRYVEEDCQNVYSGNVFYGLDAFTDLKILNYIIAGEIDKAVAELTAKAKKKPQTIDDSVYQEVQEALQEEDAISKGIKTVDTDKIDPKLSPFGFTDKKSKSQILSEKEIPQIPFYGTKLIQNGDIDINEVWKYLNLDALIIGQWQFRKGKRDQAEYDKDLKEKIYPALEELKESARKEKWLQPKIIYGYYPCKVNKENINQLDIYDEDCKNVIETFNFPRQTDAEHLCLTDYYQTSKKDQFNLVAFQIVTLGQAPSEFTKKVYDAGDFTKYLYAHGLSVETTEAAAEYSHALIRKELGFASEDNADYKKLIKGNYHGLRYSFGYPACPRLEDHQQLFRLLKPERIGVEISDEWQMHPEHSTSAIVIHHPEAKYYNVKG